MPDEIVTPPAPGDTSSLPEWARKAISDANAEAATRRVELRNKQDELTAANNKIAELSTQAADTGSKKTVAETALLRLNTALAAGIPGEKAAVFADLLKGETEADIKAHAEVLKTTFGVSAVTAPPAATDPSQGYGANTTNVAPTPQAEMSEFLRQSFEGIFGGTTQ